MFKVATKVLRNRLNWTLPNILRIIKNPSIFQTQWKTLAQGCQTHFSSGATSGKFHFKRAGPM